MKNYTIKVTLTLKAHSEDQAKEKIINFCRREYFTPTQLTCQSVGEVVKEEYQEEKIIPKF